MGGRKNQGRVGWELERLEEDKYRRLVKKNRKEQDKIKGGASAEKISRGGGRG